MEKEILKMEKRLEKIQKRIRTGGGPPDAGHGTGMAENALSHYVEAVKHAENALVHARESYEHAKNAENELFGDAKKAAHLVTRKAKKNLELAEKALEQTRINEAECRRRENKIGRIG